MHQLNQVFSVLQPHERRLQWGDIVVLLGIAVAIYFGVALAVYTPAALRGPNISLVPAVLPYYALCSVGRMATAYMLSLCMALLYGRAAAEHHHAERVLMPLLDVLQSVPILSFLPVVLLSFSAVLPQRAAAECAAVVLIFTSQAWNLIFAWYQSLKTVPHELREVSAIFRFNGWFRFRALEFPFAAISLIWNSMMSWAGGWFFLMAAEIFTVGERDFRLPGLGAYLHEAAGHGDIMAIVWGIGTLVAVVVALDQLIWRPLLAWSSRFKLETVTAAAMPASWFYSVLQHSRLLHAGQDMGHRWMTALDAIFLRRFPSPVRVADTTSRRRPWGTYGLGLVGSVMLLYGAYRAGVMLLLVAASQWRAIALGVGATALRVAVALGIALAWTLPLGVALGTKPQLAARVQPLVQIAASVPATALFPVVVLVVAGLPGGMNIAAVLLLLMGTQWYLLFNVIAGASAIPQDLQYTAGLLQLGRWQRWRILILPALFPYVITGAVTASGGAWNASIVAEYVDFGGHTRQVTGVGALIAQATADGLYPVLLAATLAMIASVVIINRLLWRRLYRVAETRYRLE
jgi:NitT/TauT family transport system permease protein